MRRTLLLVPLLVLAACGDDSQDILEPMSAALADAPNAIVTVDGAQYSIGCPDYPCPVSPLVLEHIANRQYFWLPPGTFAWPTIYLYVLRVPVQLKPATTPTILPPPPTPPPSPELTGPPTQTGVALGGAAQVICSDVPLALNIPDSGTWDFVSGDIKYDYVQWNPATSQWESTGQTSIVPFSSVAWTQMLAGTFRTIPPIGNLDYYVTFMANLRRGSFEVSVTHRMLCSRQAPPPTPPPAPSLTGAEEYVGTRPSPTIGNLVCTAIGVTLVSPDSGPWDFVSGERFLEFMRFDGPTQSFVLTGTSQTDALSPGDWQSLLNGTYMIDLQRRTGPYFMTFTAVVERGQYQHTISHRAVCGGVDFYKFQHPS